MSDSEKNILERAIEEFQKSDLPEKEKLNAIRKLQALKDQKLNIMITGATGCGKSSTINALFDKDLAKVGVGVDPETMSIEKYDLDNMILWDSPGLGDGKEADNKHAKNIIKKLNETTSDGKALIDLVLVILDGGSRDLGTSYELINEVIIPNLGPNKSERILVAINQCDMGMKGKHWDSAANKPDEVLEQFLNEKVMSVKRRIYEGTGVETEPIFYSAGYKEANEKQNPYNLTKLLSYIIKHTPEQKRLIYADKISRNQEMWKTNDGLADYGEEIRDAWYNTIINTAAKGAEMGASIGKVFGAPGEAIGRTVGAVVGSVVGFFKSFF